MRNTEFEKNQVLASASASFFGVFDAGFDFSHTTTKTMIEQYLRNRTTSHISSYGGPVFRWVVPNDVHYENKYLLTCASDEDSNFLRISAVWSEYSLAAWSECAGWSESSLGTRPEYKCRNVRANAGSEDLYQPSTIRGFPVGYCRLSSRKHAYIISTPLNPTFI